ncbi:pentatricopeptide repeat-containing protein [Tanacetum coccineum]
MHSCTIDRVMFSHLLDMLVAKLKDNIWALFFCIPELDIQTGGLKIIKNDVDVHALYDLAEKNVTVDLYVAYLPQNLAEYYHHNLSLSGSNEEAEKEANSPYLRSLPLKCGPFRNDMKGKGMNDAAKILEGMSDAVEGRIECVEGMNDDANSIEFNEAIDAKIESVDGLNDGANCMSIDEQVLVRQNKLDNGKCPMTDDDIVTYKNANVDDNGLGLTPLIREYKNYMEALLRKLKGNGMGITDPFAIVEKSKEMYLIYDDLTHWKLKKSKCRNAKNFALIEGDVAIQDHYAYLRSYVKALTDSDEGSSVVLLNWFLDLLADDLELSNGNGLTLMVDQHKGLIETVKDVMPLAEHRQCARHIYKGFRKQFSGVEFRGLFWAELVTTHIFQASANNNYVRVHKSDIHGEDEHHEILNGKWIVDVCSNIQKILKLSKDQQRFVNNDIDEFEMGASNSRVVFNDGREIQLGKFNFSKKRMFGSSSTGHVNMRGGTTKADRLIPAQRFRRMRAWLGMDTARSDTIEDTKPLHASLPTINMSIQMLQTLHEHNNHKYLEWE